MCTLIPQYEIPRHCLLNNENDDSENNKDAVNNHWSAILAESLVWFFLPKFYEAVTLRSHRESARNVFAFIKLLSASVPDSCGILNIHLFNRNKMFIRRVLKKKFSSLYSFFNSTGYFDIGHGFIFKWLSSFFRCIRGGLCYLSTGIPLGTLVGTPKGVFLIL